MFYYLVMKELRTISSKVSTETYTRLLTYCRKENTSPSAFIKSLIESEISGLVPVNKSGRNVIKYDKNNDNFTWLIEYDDGEKVEVAKAITVEFFEDAVKALEEALDMRNLYINRNNGDSVPAPTKIKKVVK